MKIKRRHIVYMLLLISILLNTYNVHLIDLKPFLPIDLYEKIIWGKGISNVSYDILLFIIIADDLFRERTEYLKQNKYIPLLLLIIGFIFLTFISFKL